MYGGTIGLFIIRPILGNSDGGSHQLRQSNGQSSQPQLSLQKIYVKDVSFEAPGAPQVFQTNRASRSCS